MKTQRHEDIAHKDIAGMNREGAKNAKTSHTKISQ